MSKKSILLSEKLNKLFHEEPDPIAEEFSMLVDASMSLSRFDNQSELATHLAEGALLNVNALGARALSIPSGEYMVWVTDIGHTMLVPTQEQKSYGEVFGEFKNEYDLLTPSLLSNWPKIERVIAEDQPPAFGNNEDSNEGSNEGGNEGGDESDGSGESNNGDQETPKGNQIQSRVNPANIDRPPILRAMEDRGYTVTSLAAEVGVQAPMISRLLRKPKDVQGDPGGRNPSMGLAARISNTLRMDPTALFPDIFGTADQSYQARDTKGNRGSGMSGAATGSKRMDSGGTWTQGGN